MKALMASQAEDQGFPVSGSHHALPEFLPMRDILHLPNVMDLERPLGGVAILTFPCVQPLDQLGTAECPDELS